MDNFMEILSSMDLFTLISVMIVSYFVGSISPAHFLYKLKMNKDIRSVGSKNAGTTNILRTLGLKYALIVFVIDFTKGMFIVILIKTYFGINYGLFSMVFAILGHIYSIFLNFKGGKGVATTLGIYFYLFPKEMIICAIIGLTLLYIKRYVSLTSMFTLFIVNIALLIDKKPVYYTYFTFFISLLIIYKHKDNIKRLISGNEKKLGEKSKS